MKFVSYSSGGVPCYGILDPDGNVIDVAELLGEQAPASIEDLIEAQSKGAEIIEALNSGLNQSPTSIPADDVSWEPPVRRPGKVLGVALNNKIAQEHAFIPFKKPAFFQKPRSSLTGHQTAIRVRQDYGVTHAEPEMAVIIGKRGRDISESDALEHVFGYSIMNDVTSPGLKEKDSIELLAPAHLRHIVKVGWRKVDEAEDPLSIYLTYHAISKGCDTFGAFGPCIVTADEIDDPNNLAIHTYRGDTLVFVDSTANLTFSVEEVIAHASRYMTLEPGDVIHLGTAMKPAEGGPYAALNEWDFCEEQADVRIEIEGIGTLVNQVTVE